MKPRTVPWRSYIENGLRQRTTNLGQRLGIEALIYNPLTWRSFHKSAVQSAPVVIGAIEQLFPAAAKYLDIGAGSGGYAAEVKRRGHEITACEYSRVGRLLARRQGIRSLPFDLTREPPADLQCHPDLAYCFEVAEHVPPALGDRLVRFAAESAPICIFTAAPPGQGGTGHINEQPREYWIQRFEHCGMKHDLPKTQHLSREFAKSATWTPWLTQNVMVFIKQ